jgi:hypothetical protein
MLKKMVSVVMFMVLLLLLGTLALVIHIKSVASTEDNWWNSNWIYRRQVNITENSDYSLIDFPVEVSFRHDGRVHDDGRDIRVIADDAEIPYCITAINSTWATVMFEINLTSLSAKSIYIYYGNEKAIAPDYPLVPLVISEGQQKGNAIIDNRIYIGWDYIAWGVQPGWYIVGGNLVYIDNNPVVLWTDFRMDFDNDGIFEENEDLITDIGSWKGAIGRCQGIDLGNYVYRSFGLGDYQGYFRTPVYVDIVFAEATLRIYKEHNFVETTQADRLVMESTLWDYARYQNGSEENVIDRLNTNGPPNDPTWNTMYNSSINPGWMAFRNSLNGYIFGAIGFNVNPTYKYHFSAKESHAYDRLIFFDYTTEQKLDPYDQPLDCKIYWYADGSNGYSGINKTATILSNPPLASVLSEEIVPEFQSITILLIAIVSTTLVVIFAKKKLLRNINN